MRAIPNCIKQDSGLPYLTWLTKPIIRNKIMKTYRVIDNSSPQHFAKTIEQAGSFCLLSGLLEPSISSSKRSGSYILSRSVGL
jgi:hypothetical protein